MLSRKRKRLIILAVAIGYFISFLFNMVSAVVPDPKYYEQSFASTYSLYNGDKTIDIDFVSNPQLDDTLVSLNFGETLRTFNFSSEGYFLNGSTITIYQSLFWVDLGNSDYVDLSGSKIMIIDLIGILGNSFEIYEMHIIEKDVYWADVPSLCGAQASYIIEIYDEAGIRKAKGMIDYTCGMLFELSIGNQNYSDLKIINSNYIISKNRLISLIGSFIAIIGFPLLTYIYLKRKNDDKSNLESTVILMTYGQIAIFIDLYFDVWLYATIGLFGNILLKTIFLGVGLLYSSYRDISEKWSIFLIIEISFLLAMHFFVGEDYLGLLTANIGALGSYLCFVYLFEFDKQDNRSILKKGFYKIFGNKIK